MNENLHPLPMRYQPPQTENRADIPVAEILDVGMNIATTPGMGDFVYQQMPPNGSPNWPMLITTAAAVAREKAELLVIGGSDEDD